MSLNYCRVCLKPGKIMFSLYQANKFTGQKMYSEMLNAITNLEATQGDRFPDKLCLECVKTLEKSFNFKSLAEKSNKILRRKICDSGHCNHLVHPGNKIQFDSLDDIICKIDPDGLSNVPGLKVELTDETKESLDNGDTLICDTIIKKVEKRSSRKVIDTQIQDSQDNSDILKVEYLEEDFLSDNDHDNEEDEDWKPDSGELHEIPVISKPLKAAKKYVKTYDVITQVKPSSDLSDLEIFRLKQLSWRKTMALQRKNEADANDIKQSEMVKKMQKQSIKLKMTSDVDEPSSFHMSKSMMTSKPSSKDKNQKKEKHICPICGVLTFTLGSHLATHEENKAFQCADCNKSFSHKSNLESHRKCHSGVKDQICDICGAAFFFLKSVKRHRRIHTGDRPFPCSMCTKRFYANCDLTRHMKVHSGYKPHKCDECPMSFTAKHQLINHILVHTKEKPYKCEVCDLAFTYKVYLNNHAFKIHRVNMRYKSVRTLTAEILREQYALEGMQYTVEPH